MSHPDLQRNVYRRRRQCDECQRTWPTLEVLDLERFIRQLLREQVVLTDVGIDGLARVANYASRFARSVPVPVIAGIVGSVGSEITVDEACRLLDAEQQRALQRMEALLR